MMLRSFGDVFARFAARPRIGARLRVAGLWREWGRLFGDPPFDLGRPLGGKDGVLVIGVEDAQAMQELHFARPEILERANAFLGEEVFDKVRLELIHGRASLDSIRVAGGARPCGPVVPADVGGLDLPQDSPIGRCYAKYAALAAELRGDPDARQAGDARIDTKEKGQWQTKSKSP